MSVKIKAAKFEDLKSILKIHKESLRIYSWSYNKRYIERAIRYGNFYVIKKDNKVIGAIKICVYPTTILITNIAIDKKHRRKGYGEKLIQFAIKKAKGKKVVLETLTKSRVSKFYEKMGFRLVDSGIWRKTKWLKYQRI